MRGVKMLTMVLFGVCAIAAVPEPGTVALLAAGMACLGLIRRRSNGQASSSVV